MLGINTGSFFENRKFGQNRRIEKTSTAIWVILLVLFSDNSEEFGQKGILGQAPSFSRKSKNVLLLNFAYNRVLL